MPVCDSIDRKRPEQEDPETGGGLMGARGWGGDGACSRGWGFLLG
jgi:hypothetical protein